MQALVEGTLLLHFVSMPMAEESPFIPSYFRNRKPVEAHHLSTELPSQPALYAVLATSS
jgi:hypothetical protein